MGLPEYDMRVLCAIIKKEKGLSMQQLIKKFGPEVRSVVDILLESGFVKVHTRALKPFMAPGTVYEDPPKDNLTATPKGTLEAKRHKTEVGLTNKEKWAERAIGFAVALILWIIQELARAPFWLGI